MSNLFMLTEFPLVNKDCLIGNQFITVESHPFLVDFLIDFRESFSLLHDGSIIEERVGNFLFESNDVLVEVFHNFLINCGQWSRSRVIFKLAQFQ